MWIIQVSDIHLTCGEMTVLEQEKCLTLMYENIYEVMAVSEKIVVIICGDIIYKGNPSGYKFAQKFFVDMKTLFKNKISIFLCPGNHDIISDNSPDFFKDFNMFAWHLTSNEKFNFTASHTVISSIIDNLEIILVNSAFHGDYTYGCIDINSLEDVLKSSTVSNKLIVTHHNAIPVKFTDRSTIVNAYEFLQLTLSKQVQAILHGHGHIENGLLLGQNKCKLVGVGSLFFPPGKNYNTQFNLLRVEKGQITKVYKYRYIGDFHKDGKVGNFQRFDVNFV